MDLIILDTNLNEIDVIDSYTSILWVDRYDECGDFELIVPANDEMFRLLRVDYYIQNGESEHTMIIDQIYISTSVDGETTLRVTGKSLEFILDRRVVWGLTTFAGVVLDGTRDLLNKHIINPEVPERKIDNFIFVEKYDPRLMSVSIVDQFDGTSLYDTIVSICKSSGAGFKITINDNKQFEFRLYMGEDRSYDQEVNPYVIFSESFENLLGSEYTYTNVDEKNVAYILGEGEGPNRPSTFAGEASGLSRKELFVDAGNVSSELEDGTTLPPDSYLWILQYMGNTELLEYTDSETFEAEIKEDITFYYGEDYFIGDIVQIENEYGFAAKVKVSEIIISDSTEGFSIYPTFIRI